MGVWIGAISGILAAFLFIALAAGRGPIAPPDVKEFLNIEAIGEALAFIIFATAAGLFWGIIPGGIIGVFTGGMIGCLLGWHHATPRKAVGYGVGVAISVVVIVQVLAFSPLELPADLYFWLPFMGIPSVVYLLTVWWFMLRRYHLITGSEESPPGNSFRALLPGRVQQV